MADRTQPTDDFLAFLRIRGDASLTALKEMRDSFARQLEVIDMVIGQVESIDEHLRLKGEPRNNLVGLMRNLYPEQTKGMDDKEVMKLVGNTGGESDG